MHTTLAQSRPARVHPSLLCPCCGCSGASGQGATRPQPHHRLAECVLRAQDLRAVPELIAVAVNLAGEQAASEVPSVAEGYPGSGLRACWLSSIRILHEAAAMECCIGPPDNTPHPCQWFSAGDRLDRLVRRAMHGGGDELAFKLLRRLAIAGGVAIAAKITHRVAGIVSALQVCWLGCAHHWQAPAPCSRAWPLRSSTEVA